ncbi:MAG: efflux RND transporter periplasmic adaptor subunit [Alphaproteobacteria bacterium]|jgi:multidrug efflux system membrane fusion protein|tara:strand:- start:7084 stop:7971 length:888 start_codon:yes stop_codon:yes gene_type:complete
MTPYNNIIKQLLIIIGLVFLSINTLYSENLFKVKSLISLATEINKTVSISSTSEAYRKIEVKSEVTSKIEKILKKKGSFVDKGQIVIKLEEFDSYKKLFENDLISKNEFNKIALMAPFNGIILDGHKIEGELVTPGSSVYEIIDLSKIKIVGYLNENEIKGINIKNKVEVSILDKIIEGTIDYISPIADYNTKTFEISVIFDNLDLSIRDGLSAELKIYKEKIKVHQISPSVLSLGDDGDIGIKVLNQDNEVIFKEIVIIEDTSDYMLISGLEDKENIITIGQQYVSSGDKVETE